MKIIHYINDLDKKRSVWPGSLGAHEFLINKVNNIAYLIVVAAREFQPTAYLIYLEGVWELEKEDLLHE